MVETIQGTNWCQAQAYCAYVGRHLCGKIGGGPVALSGFNDFHQSEWYSACSLEGSLVYPYGNTYVQHLCDDPPNTAPGAVASFPNCVGGVPGVLEMSGSVAEWEDSCAANSGPNDSCAVRGGSFEDSASGLRCDSGGTVVTHPRSYSGPDVGCDHRCRASSLCPRGGQTKAYAEDTLQVI